MYELSRDDIHHLSTLSRLELSEEEYLRYATQLSSVVEYVEQLQALNTDNVESRLGVSGMQNVMAADVVRSEGATPSIDTQAVIQAAPRSKGRLIEVRAVLGGEVGAA